MEGKIEFTSARIKRLLEVPSASWFNANYMKGENITQNDYLSRTKVDKSNPYEIIPIFYLQDVLQ